MAALAARSRRAQQLIATELESELLVDDYVWHEVLAVEDANVVDVLVETSVVDRVNPSLAEALTGRTDTRELLERAEARGLFVNRIGVEGWFAVHALVRAGLLAELDPALTEPAGRAACPRRSLVRGRRRSANRTRALAASPSVRVTRSGFSPPSTASCTTAAWRGRSCARSSRSRPRPRWPTSDRCSTTPGACCSSTDAATSRRSNRRHGGRIIRPWTTNLRHRLTMLQSNVAFVSGDWAESEALARRALDEMGETWWRDTLGRFVWNMIARGIALSERWAESCDDVRTADLALSRDPERRLALEGTRALGDALAGMPIDALRVAAGIRHAATVSNLVILRAELALAEAIAHRELGDRSRALAELEELAATPAQTMLYCRIIAMLELTEAHIDDGEVDAARGVFDQAESLVVSESFGPGCQQWLARVGTRLAAAEGDIDSCDSMGAADRRSFLGGRQHRPRPPRRRATGTMPPPRWTPQFHVVRATKSSSASFAHESRPTTMSP